MQNVIAKLRKFFSADAFEQRALERERKKLVAELQTIQAVRVFCDAREPVAAARLARVRQLAAELDTPATRGGAAAGIAARPNRNEAFAQYVTQPHINETLARLRVDGEPVRIARTLEEAFGPGAKLG